jgi:hypothetical protein
VRGGQCARIQECIAQGYMNSSADLEGVLDTKTINDKRSQISKAAKDGNCIRLPLTEPS